MVSRYTSPLVSDKPVADVTVMLVALAVSAALSVVLQLFINLNAISSAHKKSPAICEAWLILLIIFQNKQRHGFTGRLLSLFI